MTKYFPLENGIYEVKPGMVPFGSNFGNDIADSQVFQIDKNFPEYRQEKLRSRSEQLNKYYQTYNYSDTVATAIARLIISRLTLEHPQYFQLENQTNSSSNSKNDTLVLHCQLTHEKIYLDSQYHLQKVETQKKPVSPAYISTLDALATQVQEDITVISRATDGTNWASAIHLCFPNHWSATDKIGKDFATIHAPVAGMEKINQRGNAIVNTMITREPTVRFAWGLSTDTHLNHHPEAPANIPIHQWQGRKFDINHPRLYLRIERQATWGLPECNAAMFTIRTYFQDVAEIKKDTAMRKKLISALKSMIPDSLIYKGLVESRNPILTWLEN
jgi:dimethylamine monooxygenase subunit A